MDDEIKISYQRDTDANYMMIEDSDRYETEYFCLRMINEQNIPGMLDMDLMELDNKINYRYQITSKISFIQVCEKRSIEKEWLRNILYSIIETIQNARKFMLNEHDFIINPICLYLDAKKYAPYLCYLSGYHKDIKEQITDFLQFCLDQINYDDKVTVVYIYSLHKALVVSEITLAEFQRLVLEDGKDQRKEQGSESEVVQTKEDKRETGREKERQPKREPRRETRSEMGRWQTSAKSKDEIDDLDQSIKINLIQEEISIGEKEREERTTHERKMHERRIDDREYDREYEREKYDRERYDRNIDLKGIKDRDIVSMEARGEGIQLRVDTEKKGSTLTIPFKLKPQVLQFGAAIGSMLLLVLLWRIGWYHSSFGVFMIERLLLAGVLGVFLNGLLYFRLFVHKKEGARQSVVLYEELLTSKNSTSNTSEEVDLNEKWNGHYSFGHSSEESDQEKTSWMKQSEEDDDKTCVLNANLSESFCYLKACKENHYSDIYFSSFPYYIGKKKGEVDYYMDESVISRYHAKITMEKGKYYITDLNSMNGTSVNGRMLNVNETQEIVIGDRVSFSNLDFYLASNER